MKADQLIRAANSTRRRAWDHAFGALSFADQASALGVDDVEGLARAGAAAHRRASLRGEGILAFAPYRATVPVFVPSLRMTGLDSLRQRSRREPLQALGKSSR